MLQCKGCKELTTVDVTVIDGIVHSIANHKVTWCDNQWIHCCTSPMIVLSVSAYTETLHTKKIRAKEKGV